jgi:hypothetical protein
MREVSFEGHGNAADLGVVPTAFGITAPKKVPRVDYERIFVLDDRGSLLGEYALNDECPIESADLGRCLPLNGLRHLVSFYLGEYAFTPFRVDDLWFVVLTLGVPRIEDRGSIGTLLAAARVHIPPNLTPALARREALLREKEKEIAERELLVSRREQRILQAEAEIQVAGMRVQEVESDLRSREGRLVALRDYAIRMQRSFFAAGKASEAPSGGAVAPPEKADPRAAKPPA